MEESKVSPLSSITQFCEDICPFLMSIGQSRDEFWHDDPSISNDYIKAHELMQDRQNYSAWLQGHYISQAVEIAFLNSAEKKAQTHLNYLDEIQILPRTEEQVLELLKQQQKQNYQKIKDKLQARTKGG